MDLIPGYPLMRLAEVYTIGASKYSDDNWRSGISYKRIFAAMLRHAWKWFMGETFDSQDGQHHLASVAWGAFTLMEYEVTKHQFDDRPKDIATHHALQSPEMKKPAPQKEEAGLIPGSKIDVTSKEMDRLLRGESLRSILELRGVKAEVPRDVLRAVDATTHNLPSLPVHTLYAGVSQGSSL